MLHHTSTNFYQILAQSTRELCIEVGMLFFKSRTAALFRKIIHTVYLFQYVHRLCIHLLAASYLNLLPSSLLSWGV